MITQTFKNFKEEREVDVHGFSSTYLGSGWRVSGSSREGQAFLSPPTSSSFSGEISGQSGDIVQRALGLSQWDILVTGIPQREQGEEKKKLS